MYNNYKKKYLKYKNKYIQLKNQFGSAETSLLKDSAIVSTSAKASLLEDSASASTSESIGPHQNYVISCHGRIITPSNIDLQPNIYILTYTEFGCSIDNEVAHSHVTDIMKKPLGQIVNGEFVETIKGIPKEVPRVFANRFTDCELTIDEKSKTDPFHFKSGVFIEKDFKKSLIFEMQDIPYRLSEIINIIIAYHKKHYTNTKIVIHCLFCLDGLKSLSYKPNKNLIYQPYIIDHVLTYDESIDMNTQKREIDVLLNNIRTIKAHYDGAVVVEDKADMKKYNKEYQQKCKALYKLDKNMCINYRDECDFCDFCYESDSEHSYTSYEEEN